MCERSSIHCFMNQRSDCVLSIGMTRNRQRPNPPAASNSTAIATYTLPAALASFARLDGAQRCHIDFDGATQFVVARLDLPTCTG